MGTVEFRANKQGFMKRWDSSQLNEDQFHLKHPPRPSQGKPKAGIPGCNQNVLIGTSPEDRVPLMKKAFPFSSPIDIHLTVAVHIQPSNCSKYSACRVGPTLSLTSQQ